MDTLNIQFSSSTFHIVPPIAKGQVKYVKCFGKLPDISDGCGDDAQCELTLSQYLKMVEGSSDMNVTNRKKIDKEESFEKIGELAEQKETVVSKNPDSTVTEHDKNAEKQQEMAEIKTDKERRGFLTFLLTIKEIIMRFVLFGIIYLVINRVYKIFLQLFV